MQRTYCDICDELIAARDDAAVYPLTYGNYVRQGGRRSTHMLRLRVHAEVQGKAPGNVCKYCIFDAIAEMDDRPKLVAADEVAS